MATALRLPHNNNRVACLQLAVALAGQKLIPPNRIVPTALQFIAVVEMDNTALAQESLLQFVQAHLNGIRDHGARADLVEQLLTVLGTFEP